MSHPIVSTPRQADLLAIPETPFVYWLSGPLLDLFTRPTRVALRAPIKAGLKTGDDERFVRYFWELPRADGWPFYLKGGGYARWCGFEQLRVYWAEGAAPYLTYVHARPRDPAQYFRPGYTYSELGQGSLGVRHLPADSIFGNMGPGLFPTARDRWIVLDLNTHLMSFLLRSISASLHVLLESVAKLPLVEPETSELQILNLLVDQAVTHKQGILSWSLTERRFVGAARVGPAESRPKSVAAAVQKAVSQVEYLSASLLTIEGVAEAAVLRRYGVTEQDRVTILAETGSPAGSFPLITQYDAVPARCAPLPDTAIDRYLSSHERCALEATELADLKARLRALYQAGPGASVEIASENDQAAEDEEEGEGSALGAHIPIPTETFLEELSQKLEVHPISVYWLLKEMREQEGLVSPPLVKQALEDYASVTILRLLGYRWPEQGTYEREHGPILDPALVDEDGIIPLVPCGDQLPALERVRMRLERDFGPEGAEQSEREFRQWVGRDLDDWLRRDFFKRHVQQFKQRPIAWHLVSPDRTFEAFVLYHKLSRATLQKLRAQYAGGLIARLRAEQDRARQRGAAAEVSRLQLQIEDVEEFRALLEKIERGDELKYRIRCRWKGEVEMGRPGPYGPDIDDGVKVNIRPFQEAGLLAVKEVIKKW
jgi:hypothetical protein